MLGRGSAAIRLRGAGGFVVGHERGDGGKPGLLESKYKAVIKGGENPPVEIKADAKKFGL